MEDRLTVWAPVLHANGNVQSGELVFEKGLNDVELGLKVFRYARDPEQKEWAFWYLAELFWKTEEEGGLGLVKETKFIWHPWAADLIREFARERYAAVGGAGNSSKSHTSAAWGIISWLCDPPNVMVLLTSTSLTEAKKRVWKSVDTLLTPLIDAGIAPTRVRANGTAAYTRPNKSVFDGAGLFLIAGAKDSDRGSTGKLIGIKSSPEIIKLTDGRKFIRPRLVLIADELSELSPAVVEAIKTNLVTQRPQIIALSNPKSLYDPFGEMAEPADGWDSVDILNDHQWKTRMGGVYIRLDGERSPNVIAGEELYSFLPTIEDVEERKASLGEKSAGYLRMMRAVFYAAAGGQGLYTKPELRMAGVHERVEFVGKPIRLAATDTSESDDEDADNTTLLFATLGYTKDKQHALQFDEKIHYLIADDTLKDVPRPFQIIRQVRDRCMEEGLKPEHVALDDTLGQYAAILEMEWAAGAHAVNSNGSATDRVSFGDIHKTNADVYANRTGELWHEPRAFLRHKQLRGIPDKVVEQMTTRLHSFGLHGTGSKQGVEIKKKYRARTSTSPDEADTAFLIVDLAITRFGFRPAGAPEVPEEGLVPHWLNTYVGPVPFETFDAAGRSEGMWL